MHRLTKQGIPQYSWHSVLRYGRLRSYMLLLGDNTSERA